MVPRIQGVPGYPVRLHGWIHESARTCIFPLLLSTSSESGTTKTRDSPTKAETKHRAGMDPSDCSRVRATWASALNPVVPVTLLLKFHHETSLASNPLKSVGDHLGRTSVSDMQPPIEAQPAFPWKDYMYTKYTNSVLSCVSVSEDANGKRHMHITSIIMGQLVVNANCLNLC